MGKLWLKALFADLAPKADKDDRYSSASFENSRSPRWDRQRPASSPPKVAKPALQDYDIAAHAQSSLRIDESRPSDFRVQYGAPYTPSTSQASAETCPNSRWRTPQAPRHGCAPPPRSMPEPNDVSPPPPFGQRHALYPQEVPTWKVEDEFPSTRNIGGFINPSYTTPRYSQDETTYRTKLNTPQSSPDRKATQVPSSRSPPRPHQLSTPERPLFPVTPPPSAPHRPYSDPPNSVKAVRASVTSRSSSSDRTKGKPDQCYGTTGAGKRCTRIVKSKATIPRVSEQSINTTDIRLGHTALKQLDRRLSMRKKPTGSIQRNVGRGQRIIESDSEDDFDVTAARMLPVKDASSFKLHELEELPVFCFQHVKQTLEQRGTFINGRSVDFQDWIPAYLPQETQLQLRHEMAKSTGEARRGYVYVHEFPFSTNSSDTTTFIKLGRSVRPVARLAEWRSQCKSRQPIVRDIFPLHPSHPLHPGHTANSLTSTYRTSPSHQHGRLLFAEQGARHHQRWERLCLIELAGIAAVQGKDRLDESLARQACVDCGKIHVELFLVNKGSYERDVRDMVLRWQVFVEAIL